jgi:hypothetical protein
MGAEIAALAAYFGLTGFFATIGAVFAAWMAWRIVEKAGVPGWVGLGSVLLTLTGIGSIVPLILLWVFAFMRWPRDARASATGTLPPIVPQASLSPAASAGPAPAPSLPPSPSSLGDHRLWQLSGSLPNGQAVVLAIEPASGGYFLTGAASAAANQLSVPDASVGQPHARLLTAGNRLGIEDLGTLGGTSVDGARLTPEHGPRDISQARTVRLGRVDLALSRA